MGGDIWQEISWWLVGDGWRYMAGGECNRRYSYLCRLVETIPDLRRDC